MSVTVRADGPHGAVLLDRVDVTLAAGGAVTLAGASGAGKTTLLRVLAGQLEPDSGEVLVDGARLSAPSARPVRLLPQDAGQAVALPGDDATLPAVGLAELAATLRLDPAVLTRPLQTLSRGERTRARLARLAAASPAYLLLDDALAAGPHGPGRRDGSAGRTAGGGHRRPRDHGRRGRSRPAARRFGRRTRGWPAPSPSMIRVGYRPLSGGI